MPYQQKEIISYEEYVKLEIHHVFLPLDLPNRDEIIREEYENMVKYREDQEYLEPITVDLRTTFFNQEYADHIIRFFNPLDLESDEIKVLVLPSFEPEYIVSLKKNKVILSDLNENLWQHLYQNYDIKLLKLETKTLNIKTSTVQEFMEMSTVLIEESRNPKGGGVVVDGVKYYFIKKEGEEIKISTKHSPDEDSKTGYLISQFHTLIDH